MSLPDCWCGFDPWSVPDLFSPDWYRAHRDQHLALMLEPDKQTRDAFEQAIRHAEKQRA